MVLIGNIIDGIRELLQISFNSSIRDPNPTLPPTPNFPDNVKLANISLVDAFNTTNTPIGDDLVISLVSIEEEKSLRNARTTTVIPSNNGNPNNSRVLTHHPVIYLNIYLLFSAHNKEYKEALNQLSAVVNFFQRQHIFKHTDLVAIPGFDTNLVDGFDKMVFELYTTSFEQMNHLWGVLGGKYIPSALYKVKIFPHEDIDRRGGAGRILKEVANSNSI